MSAPALVGAAVAFIERKLPIYSIATVLAFGTFSIASEGPDEQIVDRSHIRLTADESREYPELRPLIATALKDDRMTMTEYRAIYDTWYDARRERDRRIDAQRYAAAQRTGEDALRTIERETAR